MSIINPITYGSGGDEYGAYIFKKTTSGTEGSYDDIYNALLTVPSGKEWILYVYGVRNAGRIYRITAIVRGVGPLKKDTEKSVSSGVMDQIYKSSSTGNWTSDNTGGFILRVKLSTSSMTFIAWDYTNDEENSAYYSATGTESNLKLVIP